MRGPRDHRPAPRKFTWISRQRAVRQAAHRLQRFGWPRLEMLLIVSLTGLVGFIASFVLLLVGFEQMWQRYPLAIGIAYLAFLLQLWWWMHARHEDTIDLGNIDPIQSGGSRDGHGGGMEGGGGEFGGAGSSGDWDAPAELSADSPFDAVTDAAGDSLDLAGGADEGCLVVFVLALLVLVFGSLLACALYLVYGAPMLMAELLVDAALSFGLYRNLRRQDRGFWLFTALRRTAWQFALAAAIASLAGWLMAQQVPGARTLGDVIDGKRVVQEETE